MNRYYAKATEKPNKPGEWNSQTIEIFDASDLKLGSFERNYHSYGVETFVPFELNGKQYALYSESYSEMAVMSLPSCLPIPLDMESRKNLHGMCVAEAYIPTYKNNPSFKFSSSNKDGTETKYDVQVYYSEINLKETENEEETKDLPLLYHDFGFVAGCYWGDDTSWKINILDLSRIEEGKLNYFEFPQKGQDGAEKMFPGPYIELPENLALKDAIHMSEGNNFKNGDFYGRIQIATPYNFKINKKVITKEGLFYS